MGDSGRDATELEILSRDDLERRVRQQTAQLENIIDTMADVLVQTDPEGDIQRANNAVRTILGYDPEAIVGKPIDVLFASPTENEEFSDLLTRGEFLERLLRDGQVTDVEVQFATAEGDALPMSLSASTMTQGGAVKGIVCVAKMIVDDPGEYGCKPVRLRGSDRPSRLVGRRPVTVDDNRPVAPLAFERRCALATRGREFVGRSRVCGLSRRPLDNQSVLAERRQRRQQRDLVGQAVQPESVGDPRDRRWHGLGRALVQPEQDEGCPVRAVHRVLHRTG
ncbi:PAS domain-containing protein [Halapricum hydrolyticum]|uniref:PAS domain-containing protein n=1 Tax=Halapricum hydrolyticum TaxID=2979991 RepID=A0AAE3LFT9_9EURY|nr:PAS domain-containing protein [Halapricum hydrolyticum]MCU4719510.1 PAS domain-containing protein [Halapricum hydrolyticum]MCU4728206.1 PAS domain-containing protein [Halapricum hydrolyticum]